MQNLINIWSQRSLTILGKICVIKSLVFSMILYPVSVIPCTIPNSFIKKLKRMLFVFVWGSKWEKVKRDTLILPIDSGGVNMIDVESQIIALKLTWVRKVLNEEFVSPWKAIELHYYENLGYKFLFHGKLTTRHKIIKEIPSTLR